MPNTARADASHKVCCGCVDFVRGIGRERRGRARARSSRQSKVETKIDGMGRPAVIFESGFTGGVFLWQPVQSEVRHALTLSYERAGLGRSDPGPEPRSAEQIAREFTEAALKASSSGRGSRFGLARPVHE